MTTTRRFDADRKPPRRRVDKVLVLAVLLGVLFSLHGIDWGRGESWNPDQMAFRTFRYFKGLPFCPGDFLKPPFHTYFNLAFSKTPVRAAVKVLGLPRAVREPLTVLWSRILTVFLFGGSILLVYAISRAFSSLRASRAAAVLFATSAGFVAFSHFLTADIPVMFWMLLAFYFGQRIAFSGRYRDYLLAGLFTGIAGATKYNGLFVGVVIPLAHCLRAGPVSLRSLALDRKLLWGLAAVAAGFVLANPYALLAFPDFYSDFLYNYATTPVYDGVHNGRGYGKFLLLIGEVVGFPTSFVIFASFVLALYVLGNRAHGGSGERKGIILLLAVFAFYYWKIGSFPRLESRFVMPVVPFLLILSCVFWERAANARYLGGLLFAAVIAYNLVSCYYVGKRFRDDPRMDAQTWVLKNVPVGSSIESSGYVPDWNKLEGVEIQDMAFPNVSGRKRLFEKIFARDDKTLEKMEQFERPNEDVGWYTAEALDERRPEYVAVDSLYYGRFLGNALYPGIERFFTDLLSEKYRYRIVYDRKTPPVPRWIYPKEIDFLENRITILSGNHPSAADRTHVSPSSDAEKHREASP